MSKFPVTESLLQHSSETHFFALIKIGRQEQKKITKTAIVTLETKFFDGSRRGLLKFPKISHSSFYGCVPK